MDTQCPTVATIQDETTPSNSQLTNSRHVAPESMEAHKRWLVKVYALRRGCLASEIAEKKETFSSTLSL